MGVVALLYHPLSTWGVQNSMDREIAAFERVSEQAQQQPSAQATEGVDADLYQDLLEQMQSYNAELYKSGQSGLVDAWSYEQPTFDFADYGLPTDVMGILRIPAMEEELPVYLGATEKNMAKGVAILGQTSMPVGGANTNCVIAGHRGYGSTAFFREIEKLQPGDQVYLSTYWGEKTYQVESTAIILPDDIEAVLIQEGRELLTLITCHPYVTATHRYVVYCTAVHDEQAQGSSNGSAQQSGGSTQGTEAVETSYSQQRIQLEKWLPLLAIPLLIVAVFIIIWPKKKKDTKKGEGI